MSLIMGTKPVGGKPFKFL